MIGSWDMQRTNTNIDSSLQLPFHLHLQVILGPPTNGEQRCATAVNQVQRHQDHLHFWLCFTFRIHVKVLLNGVRGCACMCTFDLRHPHIASSSLGSCGLSLLLVWRTNWKQKVDCAFEVIWTKVFSGSTCCWGSWKHACWNTLGNVKHYLLFRS